MFVDGLTGFDASVIALAAPHPKIYRVDSRLDETPIYESAPFFLGWQANVNDFFPQDGKKSCRAQNQTKFP